VSSYPFGLRLAPGRRRSLSARGHFLNTFAGIGFSVAFSLLALGGYLIEMQFDNPVQAQSLSLVVAALMISTAITLLYCLLHPHRKLRGPITYWPTAAGLEEKTVVISRSSRLRENRKDIPPPGRYVDRTRIQIQR
jgi:hypothetical protein